MRCLGPYKNRGICFAHRERHRQGDRQADSTSQCQTGGHALREDYAVRRNLRKARGYLETNPVQNGGKGG